MDVEFADALEVPDEDEVMLVEVVPDRDAVSVPDEAEDDVGTVESGIVPTTK